MPATLDWLRGIVDGSGVGCLVEMPCGTRHQFGEEPAVLVKFHDSHVLARGLDELGKPQGLTPMGRWYERRPRRDACDYFQRVIATRATVSRIGHRIPGNPAWTPDRAHRY
jgi:hypothetical protein